MSTATPPPPTSPSLGSPSRAASAPGLARGGAPAAPVAGPTAGFGTIDPMRLLRKYWVLLVIAAVAGAIIGTAAHFILLRVYPMYTAATIFRCLPPARSFTEIGRNAQQQGDFDRFMGTQMSAMTSIDVLQNALKNSEIAGTKWAKQFVVNGNFQPTLALPVLREKISSRMVPQTTLIRLSMTWRDKNDVRTIVQAVADSYMEYVRNTEGAQSSLQREVLDRRRREINDEITLLNRRRDDILRDGKVTNLKEGADAAEEKQAQITQDLIAAQQQFAQVNSLLERLRNLAADNAVIPYPEDMQEEAKRDPLVMDLTRQVTQLKVDEQALTAQGWSDEYPPMIAVRKRIQAAQTELDAQTRVVLQRLYDSQIEELSKSRESLRAREDKLNTELAAVTARKQDLLGLVLRVQTIEDQVKLLNEELTLVTKSRNELESLSSNPVFDQVQVFSRAQTPNEVAFPKLAILLPLGVLLLTGLTATVVLLRELMDQRVKGPADVAMIPRLRVLGMVPDAAEDPSRPGSVETAFRDTPGGVVTESFRQIRAPLVNRLDAEGHKSVLVLAGMPGSGGTTVVSNLALACAGADEKVLVIDANFRRPALHRVLGVEDGLGLADCLAGQATLAETVRPSSVKNLSVLTAGSAGNRLVPERLSSEALARLLSEAAASYERIFIDAPPAIVSGDGQAIANRCDAVIMVVRALSEKRGLVGRIRNQMSHVRAELVGVVVNGVKASAGGYFKRNIQATHDYHNAGRT